MKSEFKNGYIITLLGLIISGLVFLIISEVTDATFWKSLLSNISSMLFISGGFGLIDQYFLKEKLINLILEKIELKDQISKTGIEDIFFCINDIDYKYYLKNATRRLDIVHIYGRSWTTSNIDILREKIFRSNCYIRVVLLSPESKLIPGLADNFNYSEDQLCNSINESTKIWFDIYNEKKKQKRKKTNSKIELYYHNGIPSHSLYRIDDKIILVTSKLARGRTTKLPSMVINDTKFNEDLYSIYLEQIEKLIEESELIDFDSIAN